MLAVYDVDVFLLYNGILQRYPKDKQPVRYYGLAMYFATSTQKEHAIILDAEQLFEGVTPSPPRAIVNGVIDWDAVDAYLDTPIRKLPIYTYKRPNVINAIIENASNNDKHALSAMASNFTPAARPAVKQKVIEFLLDPRATKFALPLEMRPKRGRAVAYYEEASNADYTDIKNDVRQFLVGNVINISMLAYESRYWCRVIEKEHKALEKY